MAKDELITDEDIDAAFEESDRQQDRPQAEPEPASNGKALAKSDRANEPLELSEHGVKFRTSSDIGSYAARIFASGLPMPQGVGTPGKLAAILMLAHEIGLPPMRAIQNVAIINGRTCIWGDALPAIAFGTGKVKRFSEKFEGEGDDLTAVCEVERTDIDGVVRWTFSVEDAKTAGLWGKAGPWRSYPKRMLMMRARSYTLRSAFADALSGIITTEEAGDLAEGPSPEAGELETEILSD